MIVKQVIIYFCCLFLSFTATTAHAVTGGGNVKNFKESHQVAFMKMAGSNYYFPIYLHDLATSGTENGYKYQKPGYSYPHPKITTQLPPLAEFNPDDQDLEKEISESPEEAFPGKEAEFPTRPPAIGHEQEEEKDSTGFMPDPLPPGVNDPPIFELNPDDSIPCTKNCDSQDQIPGTAGVDYPNYPSVPKTNFKCPSLSGYYGDTEARCQAFHVCLNMAGRTRQYSFLCPNGTIFSQMDFVCVWWHDFNCHATPSLYHLNKELGWDDPNITMEQKMANLMKIAKINEASKKSLNKSNFSKQLLPALKPQIQNSKSTNDILQAMASFRVSKVANSKRKAQSSQLTSESEPVQDNDMTRGFIVNRSKGDKRTTPKTFVAKAESLASTASPPRKYTNKPRMMSSTNRPIKKMTPIPPTSRYLPPQPLSTTTRPPPTYLPPKYEEESNELPENQPQVDYDTTTKAPIIKTPTAPPRRQYLPPRPTSTTTQPPPLAYLPPVANPQLDYNAPDDEDESNELPGATPTQEVSYLPPIVYESQAQKQSYDNNFNNPAFRVAEDEIQSENQFDPVALFIPKTPPPPPRRTQVRQLQRDILQNGASPVGAFEPLKPLTFDYPPPPNVLMSRQLPPPPRLQLRQGQDTLLQNLLDPLLMGDTIDEPPMRALSFEPDQFGNDVNPIGQPQFGNNGNRNPIRQPQFGNDGNQNSIRQPQFGNNGNRNPIRQPQFGNDGNQNSIRQPQFGNNGNRNPIRQPQFGNNGNQNPIRQPQFSNDGNRNPIRQPRPMSLDQGRRPEPIRMLNFINPTPNNADTRNRRPSSKRTPDPQQTNSQLRIVFSTAAPTPTHIPVSYERFQEPIFDPSDTRNQIPAIFPDDLRNFLLPNVTDPAEVYRAPSIFEQTFISRDTSPKARKPNPARAPPRPPRPQVQEHEPVKLLDLINSDNETSESQRISKIKRPPKFNRRPKNRVQKQRRPNEPSGFTISKFLRFY